MTWCAEIWIPLPHSVAVLNLFFPNGFFLLCEWFGLNSDPTVCTLLRVLVSDSRPSEALVRPLGRADLSEYIVRVCVCLVFDSSNPTLFWIAVVHLTLASLVLFAVAAIAWLDCRHDPDWHELLYAGQLQRSGEPPSSSRSVAVAVTAITTAVTTTTSGSSVIGLSTFSPEHHRRPTPSVHLLTPGSSLLGQSC